MSEYTKYHSKETGFIYWYHTDLIKAISVEDIHPLVLMQVSDFVVDDEFNLVKCRYLISNVIDAYTLGIKT